SRFKSGSSAQPKQVKRQLVSQFRDAADAMAKAAADMKAKPAPSIKHGEQFAKQMSTGFSKVAKALTRLADKLDSTTVTSLDDVRSVVRGVSGSSALDMSMLNSFKPSKKLQAQFTKVP